MNSSNLSRVLPYLKAVVPEDDPAPVMTLSSEDSFVVRPLVGGLLTTYVIDEGDRFVYVQERHLAAEGLTRDDLHERALANLGSLLSQHGVRVHPHGKIFALIVDGNLEATLMLLDKFWGAMERHVDAEELLAVAPARDVLAVGPLGVDVAAELREVVTRVRGGDHLLNEDLYRRSAGVWHVETKF
ncbi:DUF1444 family protein [Pendulispora brunnea]|uniref:DUF1444 family protein n=1 Tax=Pendulispora brunnea TaxID=2905690 RepID=A0ABZ2KHJ8_9BACT